jgi:hypothetical protein
MEKESKRDTWDKLEVFSKFITGGLLVVIAFFVDQGSKRISRSNEEGKIIQSLIEDLSKKDDNTHNDVALLSLEKFLLQKNDEKLLEIDKTYIIQISETLLRQRITKDSGFNAQSSIPFRLWQKYDSVYANDFFTDFIASKSMVDEITSPKKDSLTSIELAAMKPIAQSNDAVEASVLSSFKKKIVYLQYSQRDQLESMKELQKAFISNKWIAPGVEFVSGNYSNLIKYFDPDDKQLADNAAVLGGKIFNKPFKIAPIFNNRYNVPKGQIEIWVGK